MTANLEAIDMETALFYATHLENPCSVGVDGRAEDIRGLYLEEARRLLRTERNSPVKEFLQGVIDNS